MPSEQPPTATRRHALRTLATASLLGFAGCLGDDDEEPDQPDNGTPSSGPPSRVLETPPRGAEARPNLAEASPGQGCGSDPAEAWGDVDPTGVPAYADDPNWRLAGHDTGNSFHNPHAEGPSDDPEIRWRFGGSGSTAFSNYRVHSPLIVDGTVYTTVELAETSDSHSDEHRAFVAIDGETGEHRTVFDARDRIWRPTIVDGTVYAVVGRQVRAYDLDSGTERWRSDPILWKPSSIQIVEETIIVTENAYHFEDGELVPQLHAFDATTGEHRWQAVRERLGADEPKFPIIADNCVVYPGRTDGRNISSGETLVDLPNGVLYPTLDNGRYYGYDDGGIVSYDWQSLEQCWEYRPDDRKTGGGWVGVVGDIVLLSDFRGPGYVGVHQDTGRTLWETEIWDQHYMGLFRVSTQDMIYILHDGGITSALDPATGSVEWKLNTEDMGEFGYGCALADDLLVTVGGDGTLFAIS